MIMEGDEKPHMQTEEQADEKPHMQTEEQADEESEILEPETLKNVREKKENEVKEEEESEEEESSPRGVLEIAITGSDSDSGSSSVHRSDSFGAAERGGGGWDGSLHWKKLFGRIRRKSPMRLVGYHFSKKSLKKNLGRNHSAGEAVDGGGFAVPKPSWRNFTYQELLLATDGFSPEKLIGKGGHAEVYKGFLPDGQVVAVKKIIKEKKKDEDRVGDFLSELGIIAHIDHPNTAKLVGFSADGGLHLVLQFSPHGSLATTLHGGSEEIMDWKLRYKVALGIAEGLEYLHCDCQRRIIHRDITASNILLSEDYEAQISDFGLAKWLPEKWLHHVVSPIEGTFGYMAPEYFMHGVVHEKTDVFAFGVLLLELITGRRAVDSSRQSLVMWAKPYLEQNDVKEIADPKLGQDYDVTEMKRAMFTAAICIHHLPNLRPNMSRVVKLLKGENEAIDMKQKSLSTKVMLLDSCDLESYTSTTYLKDLDRHMELAME